MNNKKKLWAMFLMTGLISLGLVGGVLGTNLGQTADSNVRSAVTQNAPQTPTIFRAQQSSAEQIARDIYEQYKGLVGWETTIFYFESAKDGSPDTLYFINQNDNRMYAIAVFDWDGDKDGFWVRKYQKGITTLGTLPTWTNSILWFDNSDLTNNRVLKSKEIKMVSGVVDNVFEEYDWFEGRWKMLKKTSAYAEMDETLPPSKYVRYRVNPNTKEIVFWNRFDEGKRIKIGYEKIDIHGLQGSIRYPIVADWQPVVDFFNKPIIPRNQGCVGDIEKPAWLLNGERVDIEHTESAFAKCDGWYAVQWDDDMKIFYHPTDNYKVRIYYTSSGTISGFAFTENVRTAEPTFDSREGGYSGAYTLEAIYQFYLTNNWR